MFKRRERRQVPGLNTASLPDLIFTVLFFFMIVTHMRKVTPVVTYQIPEGKELTRLAKKQNVVYICVGRVPGSDSVRVQLGDRLASVGDIRRYVADQRQRMPAEDREQMVVSVRADRDTPMGIIKDIKEALRDAGALRMSYSATESALGTAEKRGMKQ